MTSHHILRGVIAAWVAGCLLAACSSRTAGTGTAQRPAASTSAPSTSPAETAAPSDTTSAPPTTPATSTPPPAPTTPAPPAPAAPPKQCPGGTCTKLDSVELGHGYVIIVRSGPPADGSVGASVVELTSGGIPIYWYAKDDQHPAALTCSTGVVVENCVVSDYFGAHASVGTVWIFSNGTLHKGAAVTADTPGTYGVDLNGDGLLDVEALQNNYQPDYATGKVYWQTWLSDLHTLTSTGCGTPASVAPKAPTAPLTGICSP